jgi:hypothetical protein
MKTHAQAVAQLTGKPPKRARKPRLPPAMRPWQCLVLAIDPGENSGYAAFEAGQLYAWDEVNVFDWARVGGVISGFLARSQHIGMEAVLVIEKPFRGETGASRPIWKRQWVESGGKKSRIVQEYPQTWRSQIFRGVAGKPQAIARAAEEGLAHALISRKLGWRAIFEGEAHALGKLGHDACAAISIGEWACRAGKVGAVLPAKVRRLSGAA